MRRVFVDADGQNGEIGLVVVELEKRGQFHDAGHAPRGPEVEQHHRARGSLPDAPLLFVRDGKVGATLPVWQDARRGCRQATGPMEQEGSK